MGHKPNGVTRARRRKFAEAGKSHLCNPPSFIRRTDTSNPNAYICPKCQVWWDRVAVPDQPDGIEMKWHRVSPRTDDDQDGAQREVPMEDTTVHAPDPGRTDVAG